MTIFASIFFRSNLPNAPAWFYLSLILAVALFFKFSRFLSVRNWDVLALFLLVPGLLLRQEAREEPPPAGPVETADKVRDKAPTPETAREEEARAAPSRLLWFAYLWLLCGSAYFLARCLMDLALVRRPALTPNLNLGGLAWLAGALFVCLVAVSSHRPDENLEKVGKDPLALTQAQQQAVNLVNGTRAPNLADFDARLWVERSLAFLCHLSVVAALIFIGWWHFQDVHSGVAAATFYLLLPYTATFFEQWHHVWPMALLLWAVATYRWPTIAGLLVGLAAGSVYFPALTFPIWLSFYWGRGALRFAGAFVLAIGLSLGTTGLILWLGGQSFAPYLQSVMNLSDWQPWLVPGAGTEGFWTGVHWAYRIPIFIAYVAFVLATAFWPAPKNLAHLIALCAAVLIGVQFWFAEKGGVYVLWYLPLLLLLVFRPNLADRVPLAIQPETDWLYRCRRRLLRSSKRLLRLPEPMAPVQ